jgi:translation initiation factor IF-3
VKLGRAVKFLDVGHKVKISLLFRGREITRPELGRAILTRVMQQLEEVAVQEQPPQLSGRDLNMILAPKKDIKDTKDAKA